MEKTQEMRQLDRPRKAIIKAKIQSIGASESEDESGPLDGNTSAALKSLQALDLRVSPKPAKLSPVKPEDQQTRVPTANNDLAKSLLQLQTAHAATLQDLKLAHRSIRQQSLSLRDLKKSLALSHDKAAHLQKQNAQLRDAIRGARGEKVTKNEKAQYVEHFSMLEAHIAHLQHERQKRENHMEFLTQQTREANGEKAALEGECRKLQRQVREVDDDLTECRDDLLRLQPMSQVPDSEVAEGWMGLDQEITGWVDARTEDAEGLEEVFERIEGPEDLPDLFAGFLSSEQLCMAKTYPESQPIVLRYLIHRCLGAFIFNEEMYLFGLDARTTALLKGLEEGMKALEPRRDAITLRRWRSETLEGLLKMENFVEEQERQAQLVSESLHSALSSLIPDSTDQQEDGWETLHQQITLPTMHLSNKLRLSTVDYLLRTHISPGAPNQITNTNTNNSVFIYSIRETSMLDLLSQKQIRPDSALKPAENGRIGEEMLVISPALLRVHKDGKGKALICKPTVLVKLDEPMGKRGRGIKALGAWTPSWFGREEEEAAVA